MLKIVGVFIGTMNIFITWIKEQYAKSQVKKRWFLIDEEIGEDGTVTCNCDEDDIDRFKTLMTSAIHHTTIMCFCMYKALNCSELFDYSEDENQKRFEDNKEKSLEIFDDMKKLGVQIPREITDSIKQCELHSFEKNKEVKGFETRMYQLIESLVLE